MKILSKFSESSNFLFLIFFILSGVFFCTSSFSQPGTWVAVYGGNQYDRGRGIVQTLDKGYAICGPSSSYGMGNADFYLLKLDSLGKYEWQNTFGGINIEDAYSLKQTGDSGFVIAGFTNSFGEGGYDAFIVKTDPQGILQWQKTYGGSDWDFVYWIEQAKDGGYILAGKTFSFAGNPKAYLIKTNSSGDTLWSRTFGSSGENAFKEAHQATDSGFIAAGYMQNASGDMDFYLVKTDKNGTKVWEKTYGSSAEEICNSVAICSDGGFLLGGHRDTNGIHKTYYIKTDSDGNLVMPKTEMTLNGNRSITRIRQSLDGEYVFLQNTDFGGSGAQEIRLDKYNTGGWFLWAKTAGGVYNDEGYDLIQTIDSGFAFIGFTASYGTGPDNIFFVKTASDGNYNSTINTYVSADDIIAVSVEVNIFPNPSSGKFFVSGLQNFELKIYSSLGILSKYESNSPSHVHLDLTPGIYYMELKKGNLIARKKIILTE